MVLREKRRALFFAALMSVVLVGLVFALPAAAEETASASGDTEGLPWYGWTALLFLFTVFLGIIAVLAGIGGGVLFVPIVSAVFPFHLDFVRGAGLLVALSGALSASPKLMQKGFAVLRLALPLCLFGSIGSIAGAMLGLSMAAHVVKVLLGVLILGIVALMFYTRNASFKAVHGGDALSRALCIYGIYYDDSLDREQEWYVHRTPLGMLLFVGIGFVAGMFGLGAGWANVPALHLLLGLPTKIAVGTSLAILAVNDTAAAWVYINKGAVLPLIAVPSVAGMMIGTRIGAQILPYVKPKYIRILVITVLLAAGLRMAVDGLMTWGGA